MADNEILGIDYYRYWEILRCIDSGHDIKKLGELSEEEKDLYETSKKQYDEITEGMPTDFKPIFVPSNE